MKNLFVNKQLANAATASQAQLRLTAEKSVSTKRSTRMIALVALPFVILAGVVVPTLINDPAKSPSTAQDIFKDLRGNANSKPNSF